MPSLRHLASVAALSLLLFSPIAPAAECKEMAKAKCEKAAQCTYVKGYTTKAGTKVSAYCRNKGKSSSKQKNQNKSQSKSSDNKTK